MKKWGILVIILLFSVIIFGSRSKNRQFKEINTIKIGDTILNIEIADTDAERTRGLSGRTNLEDGQGMLFVFEDYGFHGIWMKDMNFPIDIAWLNREKRIIHTERNVSPETYPKVFYPDEPSLYVLETKAGFFENLNIKIGDSGGF